MEDQSQPQSDSLDLEMETSERIIQKCGDPGLEEQEAEKAETDSKTEDQISSILAAEDSLDLDYFENFSLE